MRLEVRNMGIRGRRSSDWPTTFIHVKFVEVSHGLHLSLS